MIRNLTFTLITLFVVGFSLHAQEAVTPKPSPTAIVTMKFEDTYVKVTYGQPHKRGRTIFGDLVPYGEVWRTGANEATEITVTEDIMIKDNRLPAGTYSLFTIPGEDEWTIILNKELGQWGAYNYNEKADVLRFTVPATTLENVVWEPFTIAFEQNNEKANLQMMWDNQMVSIPIKFLDH
jgi:hypothetical protein